MFLEKDLVLLIRSPDRSNGEAVPERRKLWKLSFMRRLEGIGENWQITFHNLRSGGMEVGLQPELRIAGFTETLAFCGKDFHKGRAVPEKKKNYLRVLELKRFVDFVVLSIALISKEEKTLKQKQRRNKRMQLGKVRHQNTKLRFLLQVPLILPKVTVLPE